MILSQLFFGNEGIVGRTFRFDHVAAICGCCEDQREFCVLLLRTCREPLFVDLMVGAQHFSVHIGPHGYGSSSWSRISQSLKTRLIRSPLTQGERIQLHLVRCKNKKIDQTESIH